MIDFVGRELLGVQKERIKATRVTIRIDGKVPQKGDTPMTNELVKYTNLLYTIRYHPNECASLKNLPFLIKSDLFRTGKVRVESYVGFKKLMSSSPIVKWIGENSEINSELFRLARYNIYRDLPIQFHTLEYAKKLRQQIPNCPPYYSVFKDYDEAIDNVRRWEDYLIKKGEMTEKERFKEI